VPTIAFVAHTSFTSPIFKTAAHLDFSDNLLTQGIPDGLCEYPNLEFLILSGNVALGSAIPSCLVDAPKLRDLDVGNCGLTGSLPPWLGQLTDLVILDLSTNFLNSTIPTEMGELMDLEHLELQDNSLTGPIPSHFANMIDLKALDLTGNDLMGTFPAELEALVDLESLVIAGNADLHGKIPPGLCGLSTLELLAEDIGCDVICDCCGDFEASCS
jgi:hypothetical protein